MNDNNEKKLKAVFGFPSSGKGKIIFIMALLAFVLNLWPFGIPLFNRNILIAGLPLIVVWGFLLIAYVILVIYLARKWGVH